MRNLFKALILTALCAGVWSMLREDSSAQAQVNTYDLDYALQVATPARQATDAGGGGTICPPATNPNGTVNKPLAIPCPKGTRSVMIQNSDATRYCYYGDKNMRPGDAVRYRGDSIASYAIRDSNLSCFCDNNGTNDAGLIVRTSCGK